MSNNTAIGGQQYNNTINFNFYSNGAQNVGTTSPTSRLSGRTDFNASNFSYVEAYKHFGSYGSIGNQAEVEAPTFADSGQPQGSLTVADGKITTAGGYTIEPLSQHEWKITGPDGKSTRIWGDPHVDEMGDGGKWDFHGNSTFVLGDGTKINVTTSPWGNDGATVTSKLEVISGNDRVEVTDIDKGKGKIGTVTQDGYAHANSFQGNVFVQGRETDDWSFQGKEIVGNNEGKDNFKLGGELEAGSNTRVNNDNRNNRQQQLQDLLRNWFGNDANGRDLLNYVMDRLTSGSFEPNRYGSNPFSDNPRPIWDGGSFDRDSYTSNATRSFRDLSNAFNVLANYSEMNDRFTALRNRFYA